MHEKFRRNSPERDLDAQIYPFAKLSAPIARERRPRGALNVASKLVATTSDFEYIRETSSREETFKNLRSAEYNNNHNKKINLSEKISRFGAPERLGVLGKKIFF